MEQTAYALDSSTVDLCLTLFPWARFRTTKAGIKPHTLLDLRSNIPALLVISDARMHDVNLMDEICSEAGAIYVIDRGCLDFARLWRIRDCEETAAFGGQALHDPASVRINALREKAHKTGPCGSP